MSRHRENAVLHWSEDVFSSEDKLLSSLARQSRERNALDFARAHAELAGIPAYEIAPQTDPVEQARRLEQASLSSLELGRRIETARAMARETPKQREQILQSRPKIAAANEHLVSVHERYEQAATEWDVVQACAEMAAILGRD